MFQNEEALLTATLQAQMQAHQQMAIQVKAQAQRLAQARAQAEYMAQQAAAFGASNMPTAAALSPQARPAARGGAPAADRPRLQAHLGFQGGYGRGAPPLPHVIASSNGPNNGPNGARGGPPPAPQ